MPLQQRATMTACPRSSLAAGVLLVLLLAGGPGPATGADEPPSAAGTAADRPVGAEGDAPAAAAPVEESLAAPAEAPVVEPPPAPAASDTVGALAAYASALALHLERNPVLAATYLTFWSELDAAEREAGTVAAIPPARFLGLAGTAERVAGTLRQRYAAGPAPYRLADTLTVAVATLGEVNRSDPAGASQPERLLAALDRVATPRVLVDGRYEFAGSLAGPANLGLAPDLWLRCRQAPACIEAHDALFAGAMGGVSLGASLEHRLERDATLGAWAGRPVLEAAIGLLEQQVGAPSAPDREGARLAAGTTWQTLVQRLESPAAPPPGPELSALVGLGRTAAYLAGQERLATSFGVLGPPLLDYGRAATLGVLGTSFVGATAGLGLLLAGMQALALFDGTPAAGPAPPPPALERLVADLHSTTYRNFVGLRAELALASNSLDARLARLGITLDVVRDDVARIETAQRARLRAEFQAQDARRWTAFDEDNDRCFSLRNLDARTGRLRTTEFRRCEERFLQGAVRRAQYANRPTDYLLDARFLEAADLRFPFHHHYPLLLTTAGTDSKTALALADPFEWQQHAAALLRLYQENPAAAADYAQRAEVLRNLRATGARSHEALAGLVRTGGAAGGSFRDELHGRVLADYFRALVALGDRVRTLDDPEADRYGKRLTEGLDQPPPGGRRGAAIEAVLSGAAAGRPALRACADAPDDAFLTPESGLLAESRRFFDAPITAPELARSWNRAVVGDFGLVPDSYTALVPAPFLWAGLEGLGQLETCLSSFRAEEAGFTREEAPLRGHLQATARLVAGMEVRFTPGPVLAGALGLDPTARPIPVASYRAERRCSFAYRNDAEGCSRGQCLASLAPLMWAGDGAADINGGRCEGPSLPTALAARNALAGAGELLDFVAAMEPVYWQARAAQTDRLEADTLRSSDYEAASALYLLYYALAGVTLGTYPAAEAALGPLYAADGGLAPRDVVRALVRERIAPAALTDRLDAGRAQVESLVGTRGRELERQDALDRLPHLRGLQEALARIDLLLAAYLL